MIEGNAYIPNREELAWAAGFFDGEGTTRRRAQSSGKGRQTPVLQVAQIDPQVLVRFKAALGGLGQVYGPYRHKAERRKPYWAWSSNSFEHSQAAVALLWNFLSPVKREQIRSAFIGYHATPARKTGPKPRVAA